MTDTLVEPEYQPLMRSFTNFDTIDERLGSQSILIQDYQAQIGGWTRCAFFPSKRMNAGKTVQSCVRSAGLPQKKKPCSLLFV